MNEYQQGAVYARDCIIAKIIGYQNSLEENDSQYSILQKLMEDIIQNFGDISRPYKG